MNLDLDWCRYPNPIWSQDGMTIKMNDKLYSGICSTEANKTNHKRFEDDILEMTDEPCYQSANQAKNKFVQYNSHQIFYDNPCKRYGNQRNSTRTDEDFVICWDPVDEIMPNNDDDNNSSNQDICSTVPKKTKKQRQCGKDLFATPSSLIVKWNISHSPL